MVQNRIPNRGALLTRRVMLGVGAGALLAGCSSAGSTSSMAPAAGIAVTGTAGGADVLSASLAPVKVAVLLPLGKGGEAAKIATDIKQAGEMALFEMNQPTVALSFKDTQGTPAGAAAAADEAIREGAELVIGPIFAGEVAAVAPIARQANVPVIAFSTDRKVAGNGVYLLSFLVNDEVARIVSYAAAAQKVNFAAFVPDTAYGTLVEQAFQANVAASGGRVIAVERYPADPNAMAEPIVRLRDALQRADAAGTPADALLLPGAQDMLPTIAPLLAYNGLDPRTLKLLGTAGWDYQTIGQEATLVGGWFAAPDPAGWRDFALRYTKTYGAQPARIASLGFDAVSLALALSTGAPGERYSAMNLSRASGFAGTDGLFRLRADGTSERGLAVHEVQKFGPRVIDAAPSSFNVAQF